jgi:hypothetical protein
MKKIILVALAVALVAGFSMSANAQQKMSWGVGAEVLLPMGTFGDGYSLGFGGMANFQMEFTPMLSAGVEAGYLTWSAKSVPAGMTAPSFHTIPVRVFGRYYFQPAGAFRLYGQAGLGFAFSSASVTVPSVTIGGFTVGGGTTSASSTDFNVYPAIGFTMPLGKMNLDANVKYDMIMTSGNSTGNLAVQVGVQLPL